MESLETQVADVQRRFPGARIEQTPDGHRVLVVPNVVTGIGWNVPSVTFRIIVPVGYPQVKLDSFCTDSVLRLVSGADPMNSQLQPIFGGQHRWFSWHTQSWDLVNGSLAQYVRFCERRLGDPR